GSTCTEPRPPTPRRRMMKGSVIATPEARTTRWTPVAAVPTPRPLPLPTFIVPAVPLPPSVTPDASEDNDTVSAQAALAHIETASRVRSAIRMSRPDLAGVSLDAG